MSIPWWLLALGILILFIAMPRYGLWAQWRAYRARRAQYRREDALKHILERVLDQRTPSVSSLARALELPREDAAAVLDELRQAGDATIDEDGHIALTEQGRERALHLLRAHRLWERYLTDEAHWPLDEVHEAAHQHEHRLTPEELERLAARLGFPATDPHGDPIPDGQGRLPPRQVRPLTQWPVGQAGRVAHIEDEPRDRLERILDYGLRPGTPIEILDRFQNGVLLRTEDGVVQLDPYLAEGIYIGPWHEQTARADTDIRIPLSEWPDDREAEIVELDDHLRGLTRRRLLDLGFTPGARVTPVLKPIFHDPRAYRIRGTLIALRRDQARHIWVRPVSQRHDTRYWHKRLMWIETMDPQGISPAAS
ncbi:MAG: hypothetical protein GXO54_05350 [Chloroflexi bacterium]|nr:hypothetical protein [Chloroflexota bacterium]